MQLTMQPYYDYTQSPLGQLFYQSAWKQLEHLRGQTILDFGSGFGNTSAFLAKQNEVIALERDANMLALAQPSNAYTQLTGDLSALTAFADGHFDVVICHLVLEFVPDPKPILDALLRVLKCGGTLSIIQHNRNGRIVQAIAKDYDLADAAHLLAGGHSHSSSFGDIRYYDIAELIALADMPLVVQKRYGIRTIASLHDRARQAQSGWLTEMLAIEQTLSELPAFQDIAFCLHTLLQKQ